MKKAINTILGYVKASCFPLAVFLVFVFLTHGTFLNQRIIISTLRQSVVVILICWGLTEIMSVGMMSFAAGAIVLASSVIGGNLALATNTGVVGMCVFCILVSITLSAINGLVYNVLRVPSIVLSLGIMLVYEALPRVLYSGGVVVPTKITFLAQSPYCFVILAIMYVIFYYVYNLTPLGHNMRALGANQSVSISAGLNIDRIKFMAYLMMGVFLGVASVIYLSTQGEVLNATALGSMAVMMDAFMCVFLSNFLVRFCNKTYAVVAAVLTMRVINTGFVSLGMSSEVKNITTGLMMLALLVFSANEGLFEKRKADKAFAEKMNLAYSAGASSTK